MSSIGPIGGSDGIPHRRENLPKNEEVEDPKDKREEAPGVEDSGDVVDLSAGSSLPADKQTGETYGVYDSQGRLHKQHISAPSDSAKTEENETRQLPSGGCLVVIFQVAILLWLLR